MLSFFLIFLLSIGHNFAHIKCTTTSKLIHTLTWVASKFTSENKACFGWCHVFFCACGSFQGCRLFKLESDGGRICIEHVNNQAKKKKIVHQKKLHIKTCSMNVPYDILNSNTSSCQLTEQGNLHETQPQWHPKTNEEVMGELTHNNKTVVCACALESITVA